MNIELDEVVVLDVSDEALELAAGGAQGGATTGGATYDYYGKYRCAGNLQPWLWVLTKTATFGWLFNARAASFEQNTVHRCARSPNQTQGGGGTVKCPLNESSKGWII